MKERCTIERLERQSTLVRGWSLPGPSLTFVRLSELGVRAVPVTVLRVVVGVAVLGPVLAVLGGLVADVAVAVAAKERVVALVEGPDT